MGQSQLKKITARLEQNGDLIRISNFVDPVLGISEVTDRIAKSVGGGKALLFENTGTGFSVLINLFGSEQRMAHILGISELNTAGADIEQLFSMLTKPQKGLLSKLRLLPKLKEIALCMPREIKGRGECQQVVHTQPNLGILPVLKCWPHDGGRFVTLPMVITRDPETRIRNVGMYRMQVFSSDTTGMHWHKHKTGARHFEKYKKLAQRMPVAVALGGDPVLTYSATAPLPEGIDEFMFAGYLRKRRVNLVRCITNDIMVPAEADIIIEGYIDPAEELVWEGPFGDHTGFYSLPDWYPLFHVTCITHRKDAIYPATLVGIPPQEDAYIAKATERIFLPIMQKSILPEVFDMDLPIAGVAHNIAIVSIEKQYQAQAVKVANALWGAGQMMLNKIAIVVDAPHNVHNYAELAGLLAKNFNPRNDVYMGQGPLDVLDHASHRHLLGGKLCIDLTTKLPGETPVIEGQKTCIQFNIQHKAICAINKSLYESGFPIAIISINKHEITSMLGFIDETKKDFIESGIKLVLIVDKDANVNDVFMSVWLAASHSDMGYDCHICSINPEFGPSVLIIDGTIKNKEQDDFMRMWPNPTLMDDVTIGKIDKEWDALNVGEFLSSPSIKYRFLSDGDGYSVNCTGEKK
jgi:4-hydroxy-3-polyprenylbenzoate decarboxylase